ncbi:MAG: hypothetical protein ACTSYB_08435 [Candidatus Helarchaeota archaeon]
MSASEEEINDEVWKKFLRKHLQVVLFIIIVGIGVVIGGIFVFLWVVENSQKLGLVPTALGQWTIGHTVTFILEVILWEFIFIGIPLIIVAVITVYWWHKLPDDEREEYEREPKKKGPRRRLILGSGSGLISLTVFLTWLIIVWNDGMWNIAFQNWTINYLVYSTLTAILWDLLIIGIPVTIIVFLWIRREMKEES